MTKLLLIYRGKTSRISARSGDTIAINPAAARIVLEQSALPPPLRNAARRSAPICIARRK